MTPGAARRAMGTRAAPVRAAGVVLSLFGVALLIAAGVLYAQYRAESGLLRRAALAAVGPDLGRPGITLERLNHWVYENQGFTKNPRYFLAPGLGPTPVQVLDAGGDCADKSRLLAAMLDELGIPSTLVMLYSPAYGEPTHTVVETRLPDLRAAADPVYDLVFPDGRGGLLGVGQLKERHDLLLERLRTRAYEQGPGSKVARYEADRESYRWPRTINWERTAASRAVGSVLGRWVPNPELMTRPRIFSEPKLVVAVLLLGAGLLCVALGWWLMRRCAGDAGARVA